MNNTLINTYVFYTGIIIINDLIIPINRDYIFYCKEYYDDFYLISNLFIKNQQIWVEEKELVIVPSEQQVVLELLYGCKAGNSIEDRRSSSL